MFSKNLSSLSYVAFNRKEELDSFTKSLNVQFKDYALLNQALTHRSFSREYHRSLSNNERPEFLGDSVLGMVVTEILYSRYPEKSEGGLASMKAFLVSESFLADWARSFSLGKYLLLGKGERATGGADKSAILADAFEAFIGVYYLDQGFDLVRSFISPYINNFLEECSSSLKFQDSKTLLQEVIQKISKCCPSYYLIKEEGPDHEKVFSVEVSLFNYKLGEGKGSTKKEAERAAAKVAYERILKRDVIIQKDFCHERVSCLNTFCSICEQYSNSPPF